jgi:hypothetical protein
MKFIQALIWVIAAAVLWACAASSFAMLHPDVLDQTLNHWLKRDRAPTVQHIARSTTNGLA